jgi:RimJ/RimL family protein N-acetyltransferase
VSFCERITLRPATLPDRRAIYEWMACSDLTESMMGSPEFAENPVPTWAEFCADYQDYFFDGSRPEVGRSFIIEHQGTAVGHVSCSRGDDRPNFAELDIWMRDSSCTGHGWGSEALRTLCEYLHKTLDMREFILRPSARNVRAVRSYERAGFMRTLLSNDEQANVYGPGEYCDTVVMRRVIDAALAEPRRDSGEPAPTAGEPAR